MQEGHITRGKRACCQVPGGVSSSSRRINQIGRFARGKTMFYLTARLQVDQSWFLKLEKHLPNKYTVKVEIRTTFLPNLNLDVAIPLGKRIRADVLFSSQFVTREGHTFDTEARVSKLPSLMTPY